MLLYTDNKGLLMRRIILAVCVSLSPVAASANEAQRQLEEWYRLNKACQIEGGLACSQRDALTDKLLTLKCHPMAYPEGSSCKTVDKP